MPTKIRTCATILLAFAFNIAIAETPVVVTTIKPLHSLAAQVMRGVSEPQLLITQGSPHGYRLKPSDVRVMERADLLLWVSDDLETFMPKLVGDKLGGKTRSLVWSEIDGISLLKNRSGGLWAETPPAHDDDDHDHSHTHHAHEHEHDHGEYNAHLWLSTDNAAALINALMQELSAIDPEHREQYAINAAHAQAALTDLKKEISGKLASITNRPYMVFHDAYPYFEAEFDLHPVGVVRADPEHEPGAQRIAAIRQTLRENKVVCLFNEPQFSSALSAKLTADTGVHSGILDPVGADIPAGSQMYGRLLTALADGFSDCLGKN